MILYIKEKNINYLDRFIDLLNEISKNNDLLLSFFEELEDKEKEKYLILDKKRNFKK